MPKVKKIVECEVLCSMDLVIQDEEQPKCQCKMGDKGYCEIDCVNQATLYECPADCVFGEACKNRRFQNHEYAKVGVFDAGAKGRGLRATEFIQQGKFIMEYVGEIIDLKQHKKRAEQYCNDPEHKHHYGMELDTNIFIDATRKGNISRYINHSCDPNATIELWIVNRFPRMGFFAIKDIQPGEEITFDYMFQRADKNAQKCLCGSANCRGYIRAKNIQTIESPTTSDDIENDIDSLELEPKLYLQEETPKVEVYYRRTTKELRGFGRLNRKRAQQLKLETQGAQSHPASKRIRTRVDESSPKYVSFVFGLIPIPLAPIRQIKNVDR